ncbi:hypothetical protein M6B38_379500 [Iris pallida]|uniref:Uncharacterized protein n=1 Tax=Iris pallida TaxID=29817 RepID=A0AAX6G8C2_IRIPA|nr:hypothetical protein M6B38_379500 [Iris pallida]
MTVGSCLCFGSAFLLRTGRKNGKIELCMSNFGRIQDCFCSGLFVSGVTVIQNGLEDCMLGLGVRMLGGTVTFECILGSDLNVSLNIQLNGY